MKEIELERTFLVKKIPDNLENCKSKEIADIYIPKSSIHPNLRIRKNGDKYEITKKLCSEEDTTKYHEHTITLTKEEFEDLSKVDGKKVRKIRYYYPYKDNIAEVGVFKDLLEGLVLVDFEFKNIEERDLFQIPDFCLAEVSHEEFLAGGMLAGKSYKDIEADLERYKYQKLIF
jgi:CYTH domain-containing protein